MCFHSRQLENPYDDYDPSYDCTDCKVKQAKLDDIKEFLEGIIEACYSDAPLSDFLFEDWLDEAAHRVGLKLPNKPLTIERKNETLKAISFVLQKMA